MIGLAEAFVRKPWPLRALRELSEQPAVSRVETTPPLSARDEQIYSLVQQIFLRSHNPKLRHVGFVSEKGETTETEHLCWAVGQLLAREQEHDVGLILASQSPDLEHGGSDFEEAPLATCEKLRVIPPEVWLEHIADRVVSSTSLTRLCEVMHRLDFCVLCCGPMSPMAVQLARVCDGLVLVLTANRTRRAAAENLKRQIQISGVPLLGTVLTERRFPVPSRIYESL